MKENSKWGVVQRLEIEADLFPALLGACMVACCEHSTATHVSVHQDEDGGNAISLRWTDGDPLPFKLEGAEEIADFIRTWLKKNAAYPLETPDTDGSVNKGFRIECRSFYDVLTVKPIYIVYGK